MVPPTGPSNAMIMLVGEAPGEHEVEKMEPFVGPAGWELNKQLQEAGIARSNCFITNVVHRRPPNNKIEKCFANKTQAKKEGINELNGKYPRPDVLEGLELLRREIGLVQPNVIVPLGGIALWAIMGETSIVKWRGSQLEVAFTFPDTAGIITYKVIPTYHPAGVLRKYSWHHTAVLDFKKVARESLTRERYMPETFTTIRPTFTDVTSVLANWWQIIQREPLLLAQDIETFFGHIACIAFSDKADSALCIPFVHNFGENYWSPEEEAQILMWLRAILTHPNCHGIGQNYHYDAQFEARRWGFVPNLVHDTMVMQHVCYPGEPKGLAYLSSVYRQHHIYWKDDLKDYKRWPADDEKFWLYNCEDTMSDYECFVALNAELEKLALTEIYRAQMQLWWPVLRMMLRGVKIDLSAKQTAGDYCRESEAAREAWFDRVVPEDVYYRDPKKAHWYGSPQQTADLIYNVFNQKSIYTRGKDAHITTEDEALKRVMNREPLLRPLLQTLLEYRSLQTFRTNFLDTPLDLDGRVRCWLGIASDETFRFNSTMGVFKTGTNLQNIPVGTE